MLIILTLSTALSCPGRKGGRKIVARHPGKHAGIGYEKETLL